MIGNSFENKKDVISAVENTNYDLVLMDNFFGDAQFSLEDIAELMLKKNGGKRLLIAYLNIEASENWRYYWTQDRKLKIPSWIKKNDDGFKY